MVDEDPRTERARAFEERVRVQDETHAGYGDLWAALRERLLEIDGEDLVPPGQPDPMIDIFLRDGLPMDDKRVLVIEGTSGDCHVNVSELWRAGGALAIGTGYGLNHGLWREHSWAWGSDGALLETTAQRERYFGVRMDEAQSKWFADWQLGES
jgi:hypothetical protein